MPEYLKEFPFYPAIAGETPITLDTFVGLVVLEVPSEAPVGEYVGMLSLIAANPDINDSLFFRISSSTGFVSQEFSIEPKDISNVVPWSYSFYLPRVTKDLPFTLTVEARKQDPQANDILIETTNLLLKREG